MTNIKRAILATITTVVATLGLSAGLASAHSYDKSATCQTFHFHAAANYDGNAANNSVTLTLDGAAQTYFFGSAGITKDLPFVAGPSTHTWRIDINANINTGDKTAYDVVNDHGTVNGCPVPTTTTTTTVAPTTTVPVTDPTTTVADTTTTTVVDGTTTTTVAATGNSEAPTTTVAVVPFVYTSDIGTPLEPQLPQTGFPYGTFLLITCAITGLGAIFYSLRKPAKN